MKIRGVMWLMVVCFLAVAVLAFFRVSGQMGEFAEVFEMSLDILLAVLCFMVYGKAREMKSNETVPWLIIFWGIVLRFLGEVSLFAYGNTALGWISYLSVVLSNISYLLIVLAVGFKLNSMRLRKKGIIILAAALGALVFSGFFIYFNAKIEFSNVSAIDIFRYLFSENYVYIVWDIVVIALASILFIESREFPEGFRYYFALILGFLSLSVFDANLVGNFGYGEKAGGIFGVVYALSYLLLGYGLYLRYNTFDLQKRPKEAAAENRGVVDGETMDVERKKLWAISSTVVFLFMIVILMASKNGALAFGVSSLSLVFNTVVLCILSFVCYRKTDKHFSEEKTVWLMLFAAAFFRLIVSLSSVYYDIFTSSFSTGVLANSIVYNLSYGCIFLALAYKIKSIFFENKFRKVASSIAVALAFIAFFVAEHSRSAASQGWTSTLAGNVLQHSLTNFIWDILIVALLWVLTSASWGMKSKRFAYYLIFGFGFLSLGLFDYVYSESSLTLRSFETGAFGLFNELAFVLLAWGMYLKYKFIKEERQSVSVMKRGKR